MGLKSVWAWGWLPWGCWFPWWFWCPGCLGLLQVVSTVFQQKSLMAKAQMSTGLQAPLFLLMALVASFRKWKPSLNVQESVAFLFMALPTLGQNLLSSSGDIYCSITLPASLAK